MITRLRHAFAGLAPRDRRALGMLAWVLGVAVAWRALVLPVRADVTLLRDAIAAEEAALVRERAALAAAAATSESDRAVDADALAARVRPRLFAGRDDAIAGAALAAYVTDVATAHEVWVASASADPAEHLASGLRLLPVEVRAEGDVIGLVRFLAALEAGPHAVHVDALDVRADGAAARAGDPETLAVALRVRGYAEAAP